MNYAVLSALWFFQKNLINNKRVDWMSVTSVTLAVNGGRNGLAEREKYFKRAVMHLILRPNIIDK